MAIVPFALAAREPALWTLKRKCVITVLTRGVHRGAAPRISLSHRSPETTNRSSSSFHVAHPQCRPPTRRCSRPSHSYVTASRCRVQCLTTRFEERKQQPAQA